MFNSKRKKLEEENRKLRAEIAELRVQVKALMPERGKAGRFVKRNINQTVSPMK